MRNKFQFFIFYLWLMGVCCSSCPHLAAEEAQKEFNLSICTVFKDEAPYLKEWIEFHRLVGVDHFYLYNNNSTDHFRDVLNPYIKEGLVTLIDWPDPVCSNLAENTPYKFVLETQVPGFEHAIQLSAQSTKWLALIDADEFMVPVKGNKMTDILDKYKEHSCILLTWHTYGTSGVKSLPEKTLLIEALNRTCYLDDEFNTSGVKSLVRPEMYSKFHWPPHVTLVKDNASSVYVPKDEVQLNHYFNRTEDHFYAKKVKCKEHTANKKLGEAEVLNWFNLGNDIEDPEKVIHKYVPELRKRMGFDPAVAEKTPVEDKPKERKKIFINACQGGNLFDKNPQSNRDNCNQHFHILKDEIEAAGYEMSLVYSLKDLGEFEYLLVFEIPMDQVQYLEKYPKEKLILFLWEPPSVMPNNYKKENHRYFSRVYTWKDDLVDNKTYFKFYYPVMNPMIQDPVPFEDKKLCTMIACNKWSGHPDELYTERQKVINYFEANHPSDFDLYGKWWCGSLKTFKGGVPAKVDCMKNYKFGVAYENIKNVPGYVTEKIFDCFHAGCVPIYYGASNVTDYIPKNCFIAREDFENYDQLYAYIKNMSKETYEGYIQNIQKFLASDQSKLYASENFVKNLMVICTTSPTAKTHSLQE